MSAPATAAARTSAPGVFLAVLLRDLFVTGRELPVFLAQVVLQPLFMLFVFGKVLSSLGYTRPGYTHLLFPGIVALTAMLTALQSTALPLVIEFSFTKEIEDRLLAPIVLLGTLVGAAMGLTMGTLVPPNRITVMFTLVLTPLLFTGCSQYPWPSLEQLPWFQVVTAFNPLTYVSEGMRGALVPGVPHIRPPLCIGALLLSLVLFSDTGIRGFMRQAID